MARTYSNMMPLGTLAPAFTLPNTTDNQEASLQSIQGEKGTLILFICNHCPFVKHLQTQLGELSHYLEKGLGIAAISSNDVDNYPQDSPVHMAEFARENGLAYPYLYDETQAIAKHYGATCTPDFFLFDAQLKCVYRGRFDESSPGNGVPVTGNELLGAIDALLCGDSIAKDQSPSLGCNIKWKA